MEQNFNEACWRKKPCPKVNCRKDECRCGLKFISVPANLTKNFPPENGMYSNAIVRYEKNGAVYIFSTEGVPVLVKEGDGTL